MTKVEGGALVVNVSIKGLVRCWVAVKGEKAMGVWGNNVAWFNGVLGCLAVVHGGLVIGS